MNGFFIILYQIGDCELITWLEFYRPIATAFGSDITQVPSVNYTPTRPSWSERIENVLTSKLSLAFLSLFPNKWRQAARAALSTLLAPPVIYHSAWELPKDSPRPTPQATLEMTLLYQRQYKFSYQKARQILGYEPIISFPEACKRSIGWLAFAGFPVSESTEMKVEQI